MRMQKKVLMRLTACLTSLAVVFQAGCDGGNSAKLSPKNDNAAEVRERKPVETATDLLRTKSDMSRCQEAIKLVNSHFRKYPQDRVKANRNQPDLKLLREKFHLTASEIDHVTQTDFTELDGAYLEQCFRLHEAAKALRLQGLPPLQQAERGFAWAMRQVVLDSSSADDLFPPGFVLMRGRGSADERALVFLALMQQVGVSGCMISVPNSSALNTRQWIPGVVVTPSGSGNKDGAAKGQIHLFETRLGLPVPGPGGKGVATLNQIQKNPELLNALAATNKKYDVSADQVKKAKVQMVCSLPALSSRMRYLDNQLAHVTGVKLAMSAERQLEKLSQVAGEVEVWNAPAKGNQSPPSPLRALRSYVPVESGGANSMERFQQLQSQLMPTAGVFLSFQDMGVLQDLAPKAQQRLDFLIQQLFKQYILNPRDALSRGRWDDELTKPLVRLQKVLRGYQRSEFHQDPQKRRETVAQWRQRANNAYLAVLDNEPGAEQMVNRFWMEDEFLLQLIVPTTEDGELRPNLAKKELTYIMLEAANEPFTQEGDYLLALAWLEKADRSQQMVNELQSQGKPVPSSRHEEARRNWINAAGTAGDEDSVVGYTKRYGNRYPISATTVKTLLNRFISDQDQNMLFRIGLWEDFLHDAHRNISLRLYLADGLVAAGKKKEGVAYLMDLRTDLQALFKNSELRELSTMLVKETLNRPTPPMLKNRPRMLAKTLEAGGSLSWYLAAIDVRLGQWKK